LVHLVHHELDHVHGPAGAVRKHDLRPASPHAHEHGHDHAHQHDDHHAHEHGHHHPGDSSDERDDERSQHPPSDPSHGDGALDHFGVPLTAAALVVSPAPCALVLVAVLDVSAPALAPQIAPNTPGCRDPPRASALA
jgi:hypothetical protein